MILDVKDIQLTSKPATVWVSLIYSKFKSSMDINER